MAALAPDNLVHMSAPVADKEVTLCYGRHVTKLEVFPSCLFADNLYKRVS